MGWLYIGLGVVIALGAHWPVQQFVDWARAESGVPTDRTGATPNGVPREGVPPLITGTFERVLAFVLVLTVNGAQAGTILIAWLAAKLAANWQRQSLGPPINSEENKRVRVYTLTALMGGVLSVSLGVIGGAIARCGWKHLPTFW